MGEKSLTFDDLSRRHDGTFLEDLGVKVYVVPLRPRPLDLLDRFGRHGEIRIVSNVQFLKQGDGGREEQLITQYYWWLYLNHGNFASKTVRIKFWQNNF